MDIQSSQAEKEIEKALAGIKPNMTRRERRKWYRENRKKLNLPSWDQLQTIKAI